MIFSNKENGIPERACGDGWSCVSTPGGISGSESCPDYVDAECLPHRISKMNRHFRTVYLKKEIGRLF